MSDSQSSYSHSTRIQSPRDASRSSATDRVLVCSTVVFDALQKVGSMTGVPYLGDAAGIALRILNLVQTVRSNSDAYAELAKDICELVYTIVVECQEMERNHQTVPQQVQKHIEGLVSNLEEIESFAEKKLKRKTIQKLINHTKDADQIQRYREQLRKSLDVFVIQTNISVQQNIQRILLQVEQPESEDEANRKMILSIQQEDEFCQKQVEIEKFYEEKKRRDMAEAERLKRGEVYLQTQCMRQDVKLERQHYQMQEMYAQPQYSSPYLAPTPHMSAPSPQPYPAAPPNSHLAAPPTNPFLAVPNGHSPYGNHSQGGSPNPGFRSFARKSAVGFVNFARKSAVELVDSAHKSMVNLTISAFDTHTAPRRVHTVN